MKTVYGWSWEYYIEDRYMEGVFELKRLIINLDLSRNFCVVTLFREQTGQLYSLCLLVPSNSRNNSPVCSNAACSATGEYKR